MHPLRMKGYCNLILNYLLLNFLLLRAKNCVAYKFRFRLQLARRRTRTLRSSRDHSLSHMTRRLPKGVEQQRMCKMILPQTASSCYMDLMMNGFPVSYPKVDLKLSNFVKSARIRPSHVKEYYNSFQTIYVLRFITT